MERRREASTAAKWARSLCGMGLVALGLWLGACRDSVGTALYVTIDFPSSLLMDQLQVSGTVADAGFGPHLLPEEPERTLATGETFRVLLPPVPDKSEAALTVEGLREGTRVALGASLAEVREGKEVDVTVLLEPNDSTDGGVPDGGTPDGGLCPDCANGCCMGGLCTTPAFNTCGGGGRACVACDPRVSNACSPSGACACGQGAACDPRTTDRCENGQCKCGSAVPCGFGQECVQGKCECTPSSCGGCCISNICAPGNSASACGQNGVACVRCANRKTCNASGVCI